MRPQGVNDLGALAYQHIARAMLHQLTLLFGRFDPHEAHGRSPNRELARIGQLVPDDFLPLIGWRDRRRSFRRRARAARAARRANILTQ